MKTEIWVGCGEVRGWTRNMMRSFSPHTHVMFCALTSQTSRHDSRLPRSRPAVKEARRDSKRLALARRRAVQGCQGFRAFSNIPAKYWCL
jgi:hypothetical protein